jgi:RNA polymerase sigma-70 factor, ECF subfamily
MLAEPSTQQTDLFASLYTDLRALAQSYLHRERPGHTLQATALVHEVYVRMAGREGDFWDKREHFLAVASRVIRQVLVDSARRHQVRRRDRGLLAPQFSGLRHDGAVSVLELHEALEKLCRQSERHALIVELRCFGGLSRDAIAALMRVSPKTVTADWAFAQAWLRRELSETGSKDGAARNPTRGTSL